MSNASSKTLNVAILDREFRVACPESEQAELLGAVAYVDKKMREIQTAGKIASVERIAIMAALNIAHELLKARVGNFDLTEFRERMRKMEADIDTVLAEQEALL